MWPTHSASVMNQSHNCPLMNGHQPSFLLPLGPTQPMPSPPPPPPPLPPGQVLANSYVKEVPAVAMSFKQKNAGLPELQVGASCTMYCPASPSIVPVLLVPRKRTGSWCVFIAAPTDVLLSLHRLMQFLHGLHATSRPPA